MKTLVLTIVLFSAISANATNPEYALSIYPRWLQDECIQLAKEKTRGSYRINYSDVLECAELSMGKIRQEELRPTGLNAIPYQNTAFIYPVMQVR